MDRTKSNSRSEPTACQRWSRPPSIREGAEFVCHGKQELRHSHGPLKFQSKMKAADPSNSLSISEWISQGFPEAGLDQNPETSDFATIPNLKVS